MLHLLPVQCPIAQDTVWSCLVLWVWKSSCGIRSICLVGTCDVMSLYLLWLFVFSLFFFLFSPQFFFTDFDGQHGTKDARELELNKKLNKRVSKGKHMGGGWESQKLFFLTFTLLLPVLIWQGLSILPVFFFLTGFARRCSSPASPGSFTIGNGVLPLQDKGRSLTGVSIGLNERNKNEACLFLTEYGVRERGEIMRSIPTS